MSILYTIEGIPTAWAAPHRNGNQYYSPHNQKQSQTIWQLKSQFNHEPLCGPVNLSVIFFMPIPESTSKPIRNQMLNGIVHHIKKPDRTNLLKFIEDCLERAGILSNDSVIIDGYARKVYGLKPRTVITLDLLAPSGQQYGKII